MNSNKVRPLLRKIIPDIDFKKPLLVKFSAEWCHPCKIMHPIVESIAYDLGIKFYDIDVEEHNEIFSELSINSIPTLFIFNGGTQYEIVVGMKAEKELKKIIKEVAIDI